MHILGPTGRLSALFLVQALLACAALLIAAAPSFAQVQAPLLDRERVAAFMDGGVTSLMESRHVAGATVAVIDRQGVALARGYGKAGENRRVDPDTLFRVASISKTGTWIAIMQLVEQGKLMLDDPVNDHLPQALRIPDEGFRDPIRIRHLMTHTAGFEDSAPGHLFVNTPGRIVSIEAYLKRYRPHRVRPPGALAVYSNYGAALAGEIVAYETGMDFPTYAETHIFRPLGMTSTTYREPYPPDLAQERGLPAPIAPDLAARIAQGYRYVAGAYAPQPFEYVQQVAPAGALSSSANDMAKYMTALLYPDQMSAAGVLPGDAAASLAEPLHSNFEGWGQFRHGFMTMDLGGTRWAYGHGGDTVFQHSAMYVSPELGFGIFISTNTENGPALVYPLIDAFVRTFFPEPNPAPRAAVSQAESARYAGTYRAYRRAYQRTERSLYSVIAVGQVAAMPNGDLIVPGFEPQRVEPLGHGIYRNTSSLGRVAFRQVDGRMLMYDSDGINPLERVGFLQSPVSLALAAALGAIVAMWGVIAGARRLVARRETRTALIFDALCLIWLLAFGLVAAAIMGLPDQAAAMYGYPGLLPLACWALAASALATPIALALALLVWRPADWSRLRWARAGAAIAVFAALSVSLWDWGLLGYSGF